VAVLAGAAAPLVAHVLHVTDTGAVVWLAVALAPLTLNGLWQGLLQGAERFVRYGAFVTGDAVTRVGGALTGLAVTGTSSGAMTGIALGATVSTGVGWVMCGRPVPTRFRGKRLGEVAHAAQALLAVVVLINLDLVLARHVLPGASGEYAVGAVLTKIAYWLPHAIAVLLLPRLTGAGRARAMAGGLAVCAALDGVVVLATVLFGPELFVLVGGQSYVDSALPL